MQRCLDKRIVRAQQGTEVDPTSSESEVVFLHEPLFKPIASVQKNRAKQLCLGSLGT